MKSKINKILIIGIICIIILTTFFLSCTKRHGYNIDPMFQLQWYLDNKGQDSAILDEESFNSYSTPKVGIDIGALTMWAKFADKREYNDVIVAVIDTGVDYNHSELKDAIWTNSQEIPNNYLDDDNNGYIDDVYGYNFCDDNGNVLSWNVDEAENQHGTQCAGIIVAKHDGAGIMGIASQTNVKIMSLKVLNGDLDINAGYVENIVKAIRYAEKNGAQICNISININKDDASLRNAIHDSSMLFVVSAGNGDIRGRNLDFNPSFPASYNYDNVISVANLNFNGKLNKTSNWGKGSVDIAAPGTMIISTTAGGEYSFGTGTSMAAPIVSAIAALMYAHTNDITASEAKNMICDAAIPLDSLTSKVVCGGYVSCKNLF